MKYHMDLSSISVQKYKEHLKGQNLLPGRRILLQDIDNIFLSIVNSGMNDLMQLKKHYILHRKLVHLHPNQIFQQSI